MTDGSETIGHLRCDKLYGIVIESSHSNLNSGRGMSFEGVDEDANNLVTLPLMLYHMNERKENVKNFSGKTSMKNNILYCMLPVLGKECIPYHCC